MLLDVILGILSCIALLFSSVYCIKLIGVKRQLRYMIDALNDIQAGNGNRKILTADNELTAELSFKINDIVYVYEEQLSQLRAAEESNRSAYEQSFS